MIDLTLRSVLEQDFLDIEILLIDDCSEDGVWERMQTYRDPRLRLVRNERNIGLFSNFNRCLELAKGEYIRLLCNDDRLTAGCLKAECGFLDANPKVVLLGSAAQIVNGRGEFLGYTGRDIPEGIYEGCDGLRTALRSHVRYRNPFSCPSAVMMRGSIIRKHGLRFDQEMKMGGDYAYFYNLLEHGDLAVLHSKGAIVKVHSDSAGFRQKLSAIPLSESITVVMRYLPSLFCESERKTLARFLAGRMYAYALVWYLRGYRKEANSMFREIDVLGVSHGLRWLYAVRYLILQAYARIDLCMGFNYPR